MKPLRILLGFVVGARLWAQASCGLCTINNTLPPRTFDPPFLTVNAGSDMDVVIQFALPETVQVSSPFGQLVVYPNFAIFVDSLKMDGGNTYVSLHYQPSIPPTYNSSNPANGALRFHDNHRYKQVRNTSPTHENVMVYQNPGGGSPSNPTPPRGCVRACIRGIAPTPTADTLRILLRGFIDPNSISFFPTPGGQDINNKDTTNLMPSLAGNNLWADVQTSYAVRVVGIPSSFSASPLSGLKVYPNPAWGTATLRYTLARPSTVELHVHMPTGQTVFHEVVGNRPAGESEYTLSLPAGVYIVQISAEGHTLRQQLVVLN
ncbi:MAG: T9SS type A sorting domain-containing protein [Bacteroidia bacterium]|nr:T9SS type A sorting domain-containing protein [Bacteroidia bacterium]